MKNFLRLSILLLIPLSAYDFAHAQTVNVGEFPGTSINSKLTAAQTSGCSADTSVTCILNIRPELSVFAAGAAFTPTRINTFVCDNRSGPCAPTTSANTVYNTASATTTASIAATTMVTAGASGNEYLLTAIATQVAVGVACTGSTTVQLNVQFTDAVTGTNTSAVTMGGSAAGGTVASAAVLATSGNGTVNARITYFPTVINAAASTAVQFSTTYVLGAGCTTSPSYYILPVLVQVK